MRRKDGLAFGGQPFSPAADAALPTPPDLLAARDHVLALAEGGASVVFLCGPSGTGKSAVVGLVADEAARRGLDVMRVARGDLAHEAIGGAADLLLIDEAESIINATLALLAPGRPEAAARTIVFAAVSAFPYRIRNGSDCATVELKRLDAAAARAFLLERATAAGRRDLLADDAADLLVEAARGVPRRLRVLAGTALFHATFEGAERITAAHVRQALAMQPETPLLAAPETDRQPEERAPAALVPHAAPHAPTRRFVAPVAVVAALALALLGGPWFIESDGTAPNAGNPSPSVSRTAPLLRPLTNAFASPARAASASAMMEYALALSSGWGEVPPLLARRSAQPRMTSGAGMFVARSPATDVVQRPALASAAAWSPAIDAIRSVRQRPIVVSGKRRSTDDDMPRLAGVPGGALDIRTTQAALAALRSDTRLAPVAPVPEQPSGTASAPPVVRQRTQLASLAATSAALPVQLGPAVVRSSPGSVPSMRVLDVGRPTRTETTTAREAAQQARSTTSQLATVRDSVEEARVVKATTEQVRSVRAVTEQTRASKEAVEVARAVAQQAKGAKEAAIQSRDAKDAADAAKSAKLAADQAKAAKDSAHAARAAKDAADQARSVKVAAEAAKTARDAVDQAKAAKEAASAAKATREVAEQAKAAKEAAEAAKVAKDAKEAADAAKVAKDAAEAAKVAKGAADAAKVAKDAADAARVAKDAADAAKVAKDAADAAKGAKDAADAAKVAKDAAEAAKMAKDSADAAKGAKDAAEAAKSAKDAAETAKAVKGVAEQAKAAKEATEAAKAAKDVVKALGKGG